MTVTIEHNGKHYKVVLPDAYTATYCQFLDWRKPIETFVQNDIAAVEKERAAVAEKEKVQLTKDTLHLFADNSPIEEEKQEDAEKGEVHFLLHTFKYFLYLFEMGAHHDRPEIIEVLHKSLSVFMEADVLADFPVHESGDPVSVMIDTGFDFFDGEVTLCRLLAYICRSFAGYVSAVPQDGGSYSFTYQDKVFYISPDGVIAAVTGGKGLAKMTTGQILTASENRRIFDRAIDSKGDPDGALEFQMELTTVATLAMMAGETLPLNPVHRQSFIDGRALHFRELPLCEVYRLRAFFLATVKRWLLSRTTDLISEMASRSPFSAPATTGNPQRQPKTMPRP